MCLWNWTANRPFVHPRTIHEYIQSSDGMMTGRTVGLREKSTKPLCSQHTVSTWTELGTNPDLCSEKPATNCLRYVMAVILTYYVLAKKHNNSTSLIPKPANFEAVPFIIIIKIYLLRSTWTLSFHLPQDLVSYHYASGIPSKFCMHCLYLQSELHVQLTAQDLYLVCGEWDLRRLGP